MWFFLYNGGELVTWGFGVLLGNITKSRSASLKPQSMIGVQSPFSHSAFGCGPYGPPQQTLCCAPLTDC